MRMLVGTLCVLALVAPAGDDRQPVPGRRSWVDDPGRVVLVLRPAGVRRGAGRVRPARPRLQRSPGGRRWVWSSRWSGSSPTCGGWSPMFTAETPPPGDRLTVMSSNLEFGQGDAATVVSTVAQRDVDVLVLEEATPDVAGQAARGGARRAAAAPTAASRRADAQRHDGLLPLPAGPRPHPAARQRRARRDGAGAPAVPADRRAHLAAGGVADRRGRATCGELRTLVAAATTRARPMLVVGDFNATLDHAPMRAGRSTPGVSDAAEQAGSGWQPTWPSSDRKKWLRPLIAIDHVLASKEYVATRTQLGRGARQPTTTPWWPSCVAAKRTIEPRRVVADCVGCGHDALGGPSPRPARAAGPRVLPGRALGRPAPTPPRTARGSATTAATSWSRRTAARRDRDAGGHLPRLQARDLPVLRPRRTPRTPAPGSPRTTSP